MSILSCEFRKQQGNHENTKFRSNLILEKERFGYQAKKQCFDGDSMALKTRKRRLMQYHIL